MARSAGQHAAGALGRLLCLWACSFSMWVGAVRARNVQRYYTKGPHVGSHWYRPLLAAHE